MPLRRLAAIPALGAACALGVVAAIALSHEDDPKWQGREAPVQGPIWRADGVSGDGGVAGGSTGGGAEFDRSGAALLSWFPLNTLSASATSGNDCWGYVTPQGREIAMIGLSSGTAFVDVTNPITAYQIGFIAGPTSLWRDIKVFGNKAYAVSEGGQGIQVISLANADQGQVSLLGTITSGGSASTHNVAINTQSGFLYRCGGGSNVGLRIYDLNQSSTNPPLVGEWSERYVHDAQVVTYTQGPYAGKEIAFCCAGFNNGSGSTGLYVVDVTNKSAPAIIGTVLYPHAAYSHQGWLSEDRQWFYLGDELDEGDTVPYSTVVVIDVSDPGDPRYVAGRHNGNAAITHNFYTNNGKLYCANYRSGLRVFDISAPGSTLTESAYFDTYPGSDAAAFNGLWSVYPYFPSGTVIGSDLERGLFVWRVGPDPIQFQFPTAPPELLNPNGATIEVDLVAAPGQSPVAGTAFLTVDTAAASVDVPLQSVGGTRYAAFVPAHECGSSGSIRMRVQAPSGEVLHWPQTGSFPVTWATGVQEVSTEDCESGAAGWVIGVVGDTALTGKWTLGDPVGTAAQPDTDHSTTGTQCFVTGQGTPGGADGENDIDSGFTTLMSPGFATPSVPDPVISYWYWFKNDTGANPNADPFRVDLSLDGGATWINTFETMQSTTGWVQGTLRVSDFGIPSWAMRVRFVAADVVPPSTVEAAVDDIRIIGMSCPGDALPGDIDGDGAVGATDLALLLGAWGTTNVALDLDGSGTVDGGDVAMMFVNWG